MRSIYTIILLVFMTTLLKAQDPSFSQFYANRIYLNPSLAGLDKGISVSGNYRMQWKSVDNGFKTYGATVEIQEPFIRSGFGLTFFQDVEGLAGLTTTSFGIAYAYTIPMENHNIHIGMQGLFYEKSVDWSKIVFSDQLDPVYGVVRPSAVDPGLDRVKYTDFNIGATWRFQSTLKLGKKKFKDTHNSLGISLHHAQNVFRNSGADESLQNLNTKTPPRITIHGGSVIPLMFLGGNKKKTVSLSPNFKYDRQGNNLLRGKENFQIFTYGAYIIYEGVYMGAMYQHKFLVSAPKHTNAFIFSFGAHFESGKKGNNYFVGVSYDANATGVGATAGGVYELAFRCNFSGAPSIFGGLGKSGSSRSLDCHKFF